MVLDLGLPGIDGLGLLERLSQLPGIQCPPVIVYTARSLTKEETRRLDRYVEAVVLKDGHSEQRLVEELRLFAGHVKQREPRSLGKVPAPLVTNVSLTGSRLLVVDDDMRTAYSLAALLRSRGADVVLADNGVEALAQLTDGADFAAVLMDIMMPVMDGYQAMRRLREQGHADLPVIALTAKAMQGERERCLAAGASEYLAKPVDSDELLVMLHRLITARTSHAT
jgi:CheY-like chemotaxis protein